VSSSDSTLGFHIERPSSAQIPQMEEENEEILRNDETLQKMFQMEVTGL
jgi:hypothetical protein